MLCHAHACFKGALYTKCVVVNMVVTEMQDYIKCQYGANSNTSLTTWKYFHIIPISKFWSITYLMVSIFLEITEPHSLSYTCLVIQEYNMTIPNRNFFFLMVEYSMFIIHSLVFSLEGRAWQEREPSHVTGMALAHCILGKFLGVVCHCFPPPLDVPTLATRCLRPQRREIS